MSRKRRRGQATVEFAFAIPIFVIMLLGVVDLGLGIYRLNGTSEAAREIARAASVHPCVDPTNCHLGDSPEVQAVISIQKGLIPNLSDPTFQCVRPDGSVIPGFAGSCSPGYSVRVTLVAIYKPVALLAIGQQITLSSSSTVKIQ